MAIYAVGMPVLQAFINWAAPRPDIQGFALVGLHAVGEAAAGSDVHLIVLARSREPYLRDTAWTHGFGKVVGIRQEESGKVSTLRVTYADGPAMEFGFAAPEWTVRPIDPETAAVLRAGMRILHDPAETLTAMRRDVRAPKVAHGFVAGTLVHTESGLVPIERLRVGDRVLARATARGSVASFKSVLSTGEAPDQELFALSFYLSGQQGDFETVVGGERQPVWVDGIEASLLAQATSQGEPNPWAGKSGWVALNGMEGVETVAATVGPADLLGEGQQVRATLDAGVGFILNSRDAEDGHLVDFRNGLVQYRHGDSVSLGEVDPWCEPDELRSPLHFIVVEDLHSYFVGSPGLLVGDTTVQALAALSTAPAD